MLTNNLYPVPRLVVSQRPCVCLLLSDASEYVELKKRILQNQIALCLVEAGVLLFHQIFNAFSNGSPWYSMLTFPSRTNPGDPRAYIPILLYNTRLACKTLHDYHFSL